MKTLITNIKNNEINLVSGGDGYCGCSTYNGSERSEVLPYNDQKKCMEDCCKAGWEMAHFTADITQKPISKSCVGVPLIL